VAIGRAGALPPALALRATRGQAVAAWATEPVRPPAQGEVALARRVRREGALEDGRIWVSP